MNDGKSGVHIDWLTDIFITFSCKNISPLRLDKVFQKSIFVCVPIALSRIKNFHCECRWISFLEAVTYE
jgi:hypothetical protein